MLAIRIFDHQKDLPIDSYSVEALVREIFTFSKEPAAEIGIYFIGDKKMRALHKEHFQDPSSTDCMTFPIDPKETQDRYIGDIVVCPQAAIEYVKAQEGEVYKELSLYVVHGILHLQGFDDVEDHDKKQMREEEKRYLAHLQEKNLLIHPPIA